MAIRSGASVVAAPFAGSIADRVPRGRLLLITSVFKAFAVIAIGLVAEGGVSSQWRVFALVPLLGVAQAFEVPSTQAMVTDAVGRERSMQALSLQTVVTRSVGIFGALAGGIVSDRLGAPPALYAAAGLFVIGGGVLSTVRGSNGVSRPAQRGGGVLQTVEGIRTVTKTRPVAALLLTAMAVEIFGFAYQAVLPSVASEVLGFKATGYGALTLAAGCGGVAGVLGLSALGDYRRKGTVVLVAVFVFGASMVAFAASTVVPISIGFIVLMGACMATFDTMQWTMLQAHVSDEMKGRVIAAWVFAIGFGWVGHLAMGASAELIGVRWTLAATGMALLATCGAASVAFRRAGIT